MGKYRRVRSLGSCCHDVKKGRGGLFGSLRFLVAFIGEIYIYNHNQLHLLCFQFYDYERFYLEFQLKGMFEYLFLFPLFISFRMDI